ncbi:GPW/gp25 family protein [Pseudenhygromyxa sp. WMMC2535]|uniref:GPW/gp25 family protein n=1 Tax=Pseudenhygromyxa sp. WMMC2535 TaxID=2712867 RepID=UPI001552878B|nr:GPW/gp25 family protein [Pseudenhygromyxa sp. WMMC2535]NVB37030.1 GPW/gp25 family protein [Pseudenhygromyxa sp. WMMC2535]
MSERFLHQPLRFGRQGGVAVTDDAERHLSDKIMAVLFTAPGERVNAPDFGVGLNRVVFETLDPLTLAALEFRISEGLARDLGDEIKLEGVDLRDEPERGELILEISYRRRGERQPRRLEVEL